MPPSPSFALISKLPTLFPISDIPPSSYYENASRANVRHCRRWPHRRFPRSTAVSSSWTEIIGPAIVNFWLNAGIAWYLFRKLATVPLWGAQSIAADTLGTAFILPVLTAIVAAFLIPPRVLRGKLSPIPPELRHASRLSRRPMLVRGMLLGIVAVVLVGAPVVLAFLLAGTHQLPRGAFIWFKASFAAGVGVLMTPPIGWWALMDASRRAAATSPA